MFKYGLRLVLFHQFGYEFIGADNVQLLEEEGETFLDLSADGIDINLRDIPDLFLEIAESAFAGQIIELDIRLVLFAFVGILGRKTGMNFIQ